MAYLRNTDAALTFSGVREDQKVLKDWIYLWANGVQVIIHSLETSNFDFLQKSVGGGGARAWIRPLARAHDS